jgi:uncharacterized damage-inducible protein DinB
MRDLVNVLKELLVVGNIGEGEEDLRYFICNMKESMRISKLFEDLYDGHPWIDVMILPTLSALHASQAAVRIYEDWNTIWEITNHMISWRENVLRRVQGEVIQSPANNYVEPVTDQSEEAWKNTLARFKATQIAWTAFITRFDNADFENVYPPNGLTYYEHMHGILQHDAYHLGQIVIMAKRIVKSDE